MWAHNENWLPSAWRMSMDGPVRPRSRACYLSSISAGSSRTRLDFSIRDSSGSNLGGGSGGDCCPSSGSGTAPDVLIWSCPQLFSLTSVTPQRTGVAFQVCDQFGVGVERRRRFVLDLRWPDQTGHGRDRKGQSLAPLTSPFVARYGEVIGPRGQ